MLRSPQMSSTMMKPELTDMLSAVVTDDVPGARLRQSHIFAPDPHGHYVEPYWCSRRLFDVERFEQTIWDPCVGWGRILEAALAAGHHAVGSDIIDRGTADRVSGNFVFLLGDFLGDDDPFMKGLIEGLARTAFSIISNPPFNRLPDFVARALALRVRKFVFLWRLQRLAAARWLQETPLARVYLLNPRPSMPPGSHIEAGGYVGGDSHDYAWLIFEHGYVGRPEIRWLVRDEVGMDLFGGEA